jgi:hypothetical protein
MQMLDDLINSNNVALLEIYSDLALLVRVRLTIEVDLFELLNESEEQVVQLNTLDHVHILSRLLVWMKQEL